MNAFPTLSTSTPEPTSFMCLHQLECVFSFLTPETLKVRLNPWHRRRMLLSTAPPSTLVLLRLFVPSSSSGPPSSSCPPSPFAALPLRLVKLISFSWSPDYEIGVLYERRPGGLLETGVVPHAISIHYASCPSYIWHASFIYIYKYIAPSPRSTCYSALPSRLIGRLGMIIYYYYYYHRHQYYWLYYYYYCCYHYTLFARIACFYYPNFMWFMYCYFPHLRGIRIINPHNWGEV